MEDLRTALVTLQSSHRTRPTLLLALAAADAALDTAEQEGQLNLTARAHRVRGDCFRELGLWGAARRCYLKAAARGRKGEKVLGVGGNEVKLST